MKKAIAMRATLLEFESIKPKLDKAQIEVHKMSSFVEDTYLVNNAYGKDNIVLNFNIYNAQMNDREIHETWNEKVFLEACGIETEQTFEEVTQPVIDWIKNNQHPHTMIEIDSEKAVLWEGKKTNVNADPETKTLSVSQEQCADHIIINGVKYVKEPEFVITESQILEIEASVNPYEAIRNLFPSAFETGLEVGKWYKYPDYPKWNLCITEINYEIKEVKGFGFGTDGNWMQKDPDDTWDFEELETVVEMTESEVFEALKNEAVKRGYKEGVFIHRPFGTDLNDHVIDKNNFPDDGDFYYNLKDNYLECYGFVVFSKGQWAEIIPTITLEQAEKELGKKIIG